MEDEIETDLVYDLKNRKILATNLMKQFLSSKEKDEKTLEIIMSLDDTLPDIYLFKLNNSVDIKLKERSYDIVDKSSLIKFNVEKKFNYREIYFELIDYISSIRIDEPKDATKRFESEEFVKDENKDSENNQSSNKSELEEETENNIILKVDVKEKNYLILLIIIIITLILNQSFFILIV